MHTYPSPGDYTAKLSVTNLLGDESERTVPVHLDSQQAQDAAPEISNFDVVPISPGGYAPATFRVSSRVKNLRFVSGITASAIGYPKASPLT